ncbi:LCP family protein [Kitasatospora indigofera]|uniref:LCP family glycopolymer transferase n=1 Tax=Kitasatospora indigofera TaxID=67307 RepID=UPI0036B0B29C
MSGQWNEGPYEGGGEESGAAPGRAVRAGAATRPEPGVPAPRPGGRAEARRAAQGRGGRGAQPPGDGRGAAPAGRGRKPKRSRKKLIAWTAASAMVLLVAGGGAVYLLFNGNIKSFDPDAVSTDRPPEAQADANGNKPVNVLLLGSDSRSGSNSDLGGGDSEGARSDTTILLHVYADHKHAVGISIPRNALVTLPSCKLPSGKWTKEKTGALFNEAFALGGTTEGNPACAQNTVEKLTGIRVDHTIVVDFQGFSTMTKAVDGVDVCLPEAIYEGDINPNLGKKGKVVLPMGKQKVDGQLALDYVRLRHGIGDGSDIGRMKRQQAFMGSLISKVKKQGLSPTTLLPLANAATKSMTVDPGLDSVDKLLSFGLSMKNIDMHDLKFLTPRWQYHGENIDLVHPNVDNLWATLKADRTIDGQDATGQAEAPAASPAAPAAPVSTVAAPPAAPDGNGTGIKVAVYNGTTANGIAGKASEVLKAAKFTVTKTTGAPSTNHATTLVEYGSGQKANAEKVAALFPGATLTPTGAAGISLVLGKDYADANGGGTGASGAPGAPAPPPTLAPADTADARSADDDICANTTYGSGG